MRTSSKRNRIASSMLKKIFGKKSTKSSPPTGQVKEKSSPPSLSSSALKIIYAGGASERYYMAIPAARIIEKNPSCILARTDVFRRPWDAVVQPEEILIPGQKYFIVPLSTVKKLRKNSAVNPSIKDASSEIVSQSKDSFSSTAFSDQSGVRRSSIIRKASGRFKACNRRVRFFGIDAKEGSDSVSSEAKRKKAKGVSVYGSNGDHPAQRKSRARNDAVSWQPSLDSISENYGADE